jgi:hypothetical protein
MFKHLSMLTVAPTVHAVLDVSFGHTQWVKSVPLAAKPRRRATLVDHFFRISSPAAIVDDLSVRVSNDLNCRTCDSRIPTAKCSLPVGDYDHRNSCSVSGVCATEKGVPQFIRLWDAKESQPC